jgi:hypothetical protein
VDCSSTRLRHDPRTSRKRPLKDSDQIRRHRCPLPPSPLPRPRRAPKETRSILVIVWNLLADPTRRYDDLGPQFYDNRIGPERRKRNHIRQLEALGYTVTLTEVA